MRLSRKYPSKERASGVKKKKKGVSFLLYIYMVLA
jgi:hypothetical protein